MIDTRVRPQNRPTHRCKSSPGHQPGCGLRQGQQALAWDRHKQSSGLFVSGLTPGEALERRVGPFWGLTPRAGVPKGRGRRCAACRGPRHGLRAAPCPRPLATPARVRFIPSQALRHRGEPGVRRSRSARAQRARRKRRAECRPRPAPARRCAVLCVVIVARASAASFSADGARRSPACAARPAGPPPVRIRSPATTSSHPPASR